MQVQYAQLVRDTVRALRRDDLKFTGTPKVVRRPPSRCLFVTDSRSIFVKLATSNTMIEADGARHATSNGILTPRLLARPRQIDDTWWALPFKWLPSDPHSSAPSVAEMASVMARVWSSPPPRDARDMPWDAYVPRARANIDRQRTPLALQAVLERLIDAAADSVHRHLASTPSTPTTSWTHGDLHGRNVVVSRNRLHVIDWEHHGLSLRENEAAKYLQTLLSETPAAEQAPDADEFLHEMSRLGLDPLLVWRLTGLRAAGAAAFLANATNRAPHADWLAQTIDLTHRALHTRPSI